MGEFNKCAMECVDLLKSCTEKTKMRIQGLSSESQQKFESVKGDLMNLQQSVQPKVMAQKEQIVTAVQDMGPVSPDEHNYLMETYLWTAICVFAMGVGVVVGRLLQGLIGLFATNTLYCFILVAVMNPTLIYLMQCKWSMSANDRRIFNLGAGFSFGTGMGFLASAKFLTFVTPPLFIPCLAIAAAAGIMQQPSRTAFLGTCAGITLGCYVVIGLVTGLSGGYMLWMLLITGAAVAELQLKIGRKRVGYGAMSEQALTLAVYSHLYLMLYLLAGTTPEQAAAVEARAG